MKLTFSENGLLTPARIISVSPVSFRRHFVEAFPDSQTRSGLHKNWLRYTSDLRNLVGVGFTQWLNGSFVTQKLNPNDLDLVTFLPFEQFHHYENDLEDFWSFSREAEGLDPYMVPVYPRTHLKNA